MRTLLVAALALAGCAAQPERAASECSESYIQFSRPGDYKCEVFATEMGTGQGQAKRFNIFGRTTEQFTLSLQTVVVWDYRSTLPMNASTDYLARIQSHSAYTRRGTGWSPLRSLAGYNVSEFRVDDWSCYGLARHGGSAAGGYSNAVRGYFCAPKGKPMTDADFQALAANISVRS